MLGKEEFAALFNVKKNAVEIFEKEFAAQFNAAEAIAFPYGRSAQWAFFRALGIENAEVIMPAYTCSVVAHAVSLSNNTPVFIDISSSDYNMDLDAVAAAVNQNTKAIIATHTFGYAQDTDRLKNIVKEAEAKYGHKIWLMQDCCHAFSAEWNGKPIGTEGDVAVYALNISKMMTSIFGGMLCVNDSTLATKIRAWRDEHFKKPGVLKSIKRRLYLVAIYIAFHPAVYGFTWWLQEKTPLLNYFTKSFHLDDKIHFPPDYLDKMSNVEASVGRAQLKKYAVIIERRRENAAYYHNNLIRRQGWEFPPLIKGATYSHYVVSVPDRQAVINAVAKKGVHLGELIQYSIPELGSYKKQEAAYPVSLLKSTNTINLPVNVNLETSKKVVKAINSLN